MRPGSTSCGPLCRPLLPALTAYERASPATPAVWRIAHDAAGRPQTMTLQNLFLGVNAHINYDLVLTVVELLAPEWADLSAAERRVRYADYTHVNAVIGRTIDVVQDEIVERATPALELVDRVLGRLDERAIRTRWRVARGRVAPCGGHARNVRPGELRTGTSGRRGGNSRAGRADLGAAGFLQSFQKHPRKWAKGAIDKQQAWVSRWSHRRHLQKRTFAPLRRICKSSPLNQAEGTDSAQRRKDAKERKERRMSTTMTWKPVLPNVYLFPDSCNVYAIVGPDGVLIVDAGTGRWLDHLASCRRRCRRWPARTSSATTPGRRPGRAAGHPGLRAGRRAGDLRQSAPALPPARHLHHLRQLGTCSPIEPVPVAGVLDDYAHVRLCGLELEIVPLPGVTVTQCGLAFTVPGTDLRAVCCGEAIHSPGRVARVAPYQYNYNDLGGAVAAYYSAGDLRRYSRMPSCPAWARPCCRNATRRWRCCRTT